MFAANADGAPTNVVPLLAHVTVAITALGHTISISPSIAAAPAGSVIAIDTAVVVRYTYAVFEATVYDVVAPFAAIVLPVKDTVVNVPAAGVVAPIGPGFVRSTNPFLNASITTVISSPMQLLLR